MKKEKLYRRILKKLPIIIGWRKPAKHLPELYRIRRIVITALTFTLVLTACSPERESKQLLHSPFSVAPPAYKKTSLASKAHKKEPLLPAELPEGCPDMPQEPLEDLYFKSFYKPEDDTRSTFNLEAREKYQAQTRKLRAFENRLLRMTNRYILSNRQDSQAARCSLAWLLQWAQANALAGDTNSQGRFIRQWTLASLASAYVQVRDFPGAAPEQKEVIEEWIEDVSKLVRMHYPNDLTRPENISQINNHLYWGAWAVTIAGVATGNTSDYRWGVEKARYALLVQAQENATFPLELSRGKKALQYHIFAMTPLVMIAETAKSNGEDLYDLRESMIGRIAKKIIRDLPDGKTFEHLSGIIQEPIDEISPEHFAWMEVYNARFPDPELTEFLKTKRPVFSRRTGGDMTALFSRKNQN